jgi:hypothetical protein
MRRLTDRFDTWTSNRADVRDERGAVLVFVAVGLVMLMGFVAFTVDFGRIYSERRELQNGADAAALAVAQDCAFGNCDGGYDPYPVAEQYADANASDGLASVDDVDLDLGAQQVMVHAITEDPGGDNFFDMTFAKVVGYDGLTVAADATVAWGAPKGGATLPIIFSLCEWEKFEGITHPGSAVEDGELPPTSGYPRVNEYVTIFFHGDSEPCHESPSGQDLPGGFGWLESVSGCSAEIDFDGWVGIDPGASPTTGCSATFMENLIGEVVLIPYFDDVVGTGNSAQYHVAGFGAIYITGYEFTGQYKENSVITGDKACSPPDKCIEGYLIDPWIASGGGEIGGGNFGVVVIQFVE